MLSALRQTSSFLTASLIAKLIDLGLKKTRLIPGTKCKQVLKRSMIPSSGEKLCHMYF